MIQDTNQSLSGGRKGSFFAASALPQRIAAAGAWLIGLYVGAWTLASFIAVYLLTGSGLRFDTYEMLLMGHEWRWSYWKHPAMPPWVTEAVYDLTGHSALALDILPVLWIAAALWLILKLCRPILGEAGAVIAALVSLGSFYVMTPIGHFNHNIAQYPFWVLTVYAYRKAVEAPTLLRWLGLAVSAALLMQTKYTGVLLLVTLAVHAFAYPEGRKALRTPAAWAGIALALLLIGAQGFEMLKDAPSAVAYAVYDRPAVHSWYGYILAPFALLGAQIGFHAPILLLAAAALPFTAAGRAKAEKIALPDRSAFDTSLLVAATAGPLVLGLVFFGVLGVEGRPEALGSLFMLVGPSLVALFPRAIPVARPRLAFAAALVVVLGPVLGNVLDPVLGPRLTHKVGTEQIPFAALVPQVEADWQKRTGRPLTIVAGEARVAGGFAAFANPRLSVLQDGELFKSPWITPERLKREGVLFVWRTYKGDPSGPPYPEIAAAMAHYPLVRLPPIIVTVRSGGVALPVQINRAMLPPEG